MPDSCMLTLRVEGAALGVTKAKEPRASIMVQSLVTCFTDDCSEYYENSATPIEATTDVQKVWSGVCW